MLTGLLLMVAGCRESRAPVRSTTRELMGTPVTVTVVDRDPDDARNAIEAAFAAMAEVDRSMSTYKPESEISRLDRAGTLEVSDAFLTVLQAALEVHRESHGAFDVTMRPLLELYSESFEATGAPPSREALDAVLARVDSDLIAIDGHRVSLPPGTELTLDALAKGYAIDRAIEALRERGIRDALVDAGGDVRALGDKDGAPWKVAMQDPRDASSYLEVIALADRAVATSGDYRRYFDPQMRYHHLLDPRTGESAEALISVSVLAPTAMRADALATAVFVLGPRDGLALVESLPGIEAFLVTDDRELLQSSGW